MKVVQDCFLFRITYVCVMHSALAAFLEMVCYINIIVFYVTYLLGQRFFSAAALSV